jgi:DNA-binding transcriptional ArsR family regulator
MVEPGAPVDQLAGLAANGFDPRMHQRAGGPRVPGTPLVRGGCWGQPGGGVPTQPEPRRVVSTPSAACGRPGQEQTIAELEAATSIPQQTVSREVERLLRAGLLDDRRQGRMHFVRPNPANPYFPELSGLLLKALGPRSVLAEQLEPLEGIDEATSSARGPGGTRVSQGRRPATSTSSSSASLTLTGCTRPAAKPVRSSARRSTR